MADAAKSKKLCFVIGPIGDAGSPQRIHADWLLDGIIKPVIAAFPDFSVKRADHDPRPGMIDVQMIIDVLNADLVIADLSFSNPNAFYEIGIRHMAQKPIIHMQLAVENPPFDVSLYRAIKFSLEKHSDLGTAQDELERAVNAILAPDYKVENPVTNARGSARLQEHATPELQVLMNKIDAMQAQLAYFGNYIHGDAARRDLERKAYIVDTVGAGILSPYFQQGTQPLGVSPALIHALMNDPGQRPTAPGVASPAPSGLAHSGGGYDTGKLTPKSEK